MQNQTSVITPYTIAGAHAFLLLLPCKWIPACQAGLAFSNPDTWKQKFDTKEHQLHQIQWYRISNSIGIITPLWAVHVWIHPPLLHITKQYNLLAYILLFTVTSCLVTRLVANDSVYPVHYKLRCVWLDVLYIIQITCLCTSFFRKITFSVDHLRPLRTCWCLCLLQQPFLSMLSASKHYIGRISYFTV